MNDDETEKPLRSSKLTADQTDAAAKWFNEKTGGGPTCSLCGNDNWALLEDFVSPVRIGPNGYELGGIGYPHFMIACTNCAQVHYINAVKVGLVDKNEGGDQ